MLIPGRRARISLGSSQARPAAPVLHGAAGPTVVVRDVPSELYGPTGALVALAIGTTVLLRFIWVLWLEHLSDTAEDRRRLDAALAGWREQTEANNRLAAAWEERNRRDAQRRRRGDP